MKYVARSIATLAICCISWHTARAEATEAGPSGENSTATTQAQEKKTDIDEIVVTARRRDERLQDVPASVAAVSAAQLQTYNITNVQDAAKLVPQLIVGRSTSGSQANITLRGVGTSSLSAGFDQDVAINIDNISLARGNAIAMGYLDMAQLEVINGPQSLYYGKNSPGGVVSITTADPTQKAEVSGNVGYEFESQETYGEAVLSGPLSPTVEARIAVGASRAAGYFNNVSQSFYDSIHEWVVPGAQDQRFPGETEAAGRFTTIYHPSDQLQIRGKVFVGHYEGAAVRQFSKCYTGQPGTIGQPAIFGVVDPYEDCKINREVSAPSSPLPIASGSIGYVNPSVPGYDARSVLASVDAAYTADNFKVASITGYYYNNVGSQNALQAGEVWNQQVDKYWSINEELRLSSKFDGPVNVVVGGFYQAAGLGSGQSVNLFDVGRDAVTGRYQSFDKYGHTNDRTVSALTELIWSIRDDLELDGGARYTKESKDFSIYYTYVHSALAARYPLDQPVLGNLSESNVSPAATLRYTPSKDLMVYLAYRTGFKSGGFNASALPTFGTTASQLQYRAEKAHGWELGAKSELLGRRLILNGSVYDTTYTNLQVQALQNTINYVVGNAGKLSVRGAELTPTLDLSDGDRSLEFHSSLAYNKAVYHDYLGPCWAGESIAAGCDVSFNPAAGAFVSQNYDGKTPPRAPLWTAGLGFGFERPIANGFRLGLTGDVRYMDSFQTSDTLRPDAFQGAYANVDASLSLINDSGHWRVSILGRNLTDNIVMTTSNDPTFDGAGTGTKNAFKSAVTGITLPGRYVALDFRWSL